MIHIITKYEVFTWVKMIENHINILSLKTLIRQLTMTCFTV